MRAALLALPSLAIACSSGAPPSAPSPARAPDAAPPAARRSAALDEFFKTSVADWIIALSKDATAAERPIPPDGLSTGAAAAISEFVAAIEALARGQTQPRPSIVAARLNEALAAAALDYAADAMTLPGEPDLIVVFTFTVERTNRFRDQRGGEHTIRWLRRLDELAFRYQLLGYTDEDRQPVVLLDSVEEFISRGLFASPEAASASEAAVRSAAHAAAVARAGQGAQVLAESLRARRDLFERWRGHGLSLKTPPRRLLDRRWREKLGRIVPAGELAEVDQIEAHLAEASVSAAYGVLVELVAAATEGHELQHRLDLSGPGLSSDVALAVAHGSRAFVLGELSAVLGEFARNPESAHLSLARLSEIAAAPSASLEGIATRAALALVSGEAPSATDEDLAAAIAAIAERDPAAIAKAAAAAWQATFGRELEPIEPI